MLIALVLQRSTRFAYHMLRCENWASRLMGRLTLNFRAQDGFSLGTNVSFAQPADQVSV